MEIGEEHLALLDPGPLRLDRLLHLEDQLGLGPDVVHLGNDRRADARVRVVGEAPSEARAGPAAAGPGAPRAGRSALAARFPPGSHPPPGPPSGAACRRRWRASRCPGKTTYSRIPRTRAPAPRESAGTAASSCRRRTRWRAPSARTCVDPRTASLRWRTRCRFAPCPSRD